jgi:hypothetical protein
LSTTNELGGKYVEFPFISFNDIVAATAIFLTSICLEEEALVKFTRYTSLMSITTWK